MTNIIRTLLVTTALCGLLAVSPAKAASDADAATTATTTTSSTSGSKSIANGTIIPGVTAKSTSATAVVTHTRLTLHDVSEIQKQLAAKGFYKSTVDGQFGPGTQDAMRDYQTSEGLEANGYPTSATLEKLGVTPENPTVTGDEEPAGKGAVFTETVERKDVEVTKGSGFARIDTKSPNGGSCLKCTNGPIGNGGTPSMHSNEY